MKIDYYFEYPIDSSIKEAVMDVLDGRVHYGGKYTKQIEAGVAEVCGVAHGRSANSGTSALLMALHAYGIGPGDEVIVPANSYVANAEVVIHRGAHPVFVDSEPDTTCLDPQAVEAAITPRTKAIVVVHNYGHPADLSPIVDVAKKNGIKVIENACHSLGALYKGKPVCSYGDAGFISISHKILSVCGLGGILVTNDEGLANAIHELRLHGRQGVQELHVDYGMLSIGYNFRMNELSAAVGAMQLGSIANWNESRRQNAAKYTKLIKDADLPVITPVAKNYATPVYLHYVIRVPEVRNKLKAYLAEQGIETKVHYPIPNHLQQPIIDIVGKQGPFPVAEQSCKEVLSLPCDPAMDDGRLEYVVDSMKRFFSAAQ